MSGSMPVACLDHRPSQIETALEFLKRTRSELRQLRLVRVSKDRFELFDVNGDSFLIRGLGYPDADIVAVLDAVNAAFKRDTIHDPTDEPYKEFKTGRRRPWAVDRVM